MKVLVATTNSAKVAEISRILLDCGLDSFGLPAAECDDVQETGATFEENALIKARYHHQRTGLITVADDSGLEVDALGGAPGIRSARYAGPGATDAVRIRRLLGDLSEVPGDKRGARFVCAAAIAWKGGERVFPGEVHGRILDSPRGLDGFGYDPVFFYAPLSRTFAELTREQKSKVSHRGIAFEKLAAWIKLEGLESLLGP
ncbi:MAG TPA: RdgB/HAM1 family non-canonical purine NTP pyrophosphatase [Blastocatellia bacterium]|nr:RdgB/HAM1 family non-canonical purine NTP pyrophosphatase [Blastocatellia bacterium]